MNRSLSPRLDPTSRRGSLSLTSAFAAAAALLVLLPGLVGPYGPFIDELYYVSCADRLAWGYVDHPPLAPLVLHVSRWLLGDGLFAVRLPIALAMAATVALAGSTARRLGAGAWGQAVAALSVLAAPGLEVMFGFFSMNGLEILAWSAGLRLLIEIELDGRPRLWIALGALLGVSFLAKHTAATFGAAVAVSLLVTPARRHLARPWPWVGAAVAVAIALPNLAWQVAHDWPSLEFYRSATAAKNVPTGPLQALLGQVLFVGPGALPLAVLGLAMLWRRRGPDLRHLSVTAVLLLAALVWSGQSRPDRVAGLYPVLFAVGAAGLERWAALAATRWRRAIAPAWLVAWGLITAPAVLPILSPPAAARYASAIGASRPIERGAGKRTALPQFLADRLGWEQLVDDVAAVRDRLPAGERGRAVFFATSYGPASAIDWLGRQRGLGPVYSTHNSWHMWGPPRGPVDVAIVVGDQRERLEELFADVELARVHTCGLCMPWRDQMPIWVVRRPRVSIAGQWPAWKHYE